MQPLVLLALPVLLAVLPWRRMVPFLVRARAARPRCCSAATAIANWHDTYRSVTSQPNSPVINHPTAWTSLAPQMAGQNVAAGPFRLATIALACLCALAVAAALAVPGGRRRPAARQPGRDGTDADDPWPAALLADVLWWVALTLALRSFFEPVMVSYYPWPPMAVALIPAATLSWPRLVAAGVLGRRPHRRRPGPLARGLDLVGAARRGPGRAAGPRPAHPARHAQPRCCAPSDGPSRRSRNFCARIRHKSYRGPRVTGQPPPGPVVT